MNFTLTPDQIALKNNCKAFSESEILPYLDHLENNLDYRKKCFKRMSDEGFFHLALSKHYGSKSPDYMAYMLALAEIAKADAGMAVTMAVTNMVAEAISIYGSHNQKNTYLAQIVNGDAIPCSFALTERESGSDAKSIQLKAEEDKEDFNAFTLTGEKQFITNADIAGLILVFAKTDAKAGDKGMTAFIIEKNTPGLIVTKKEQKLGLLTANLVDLRFEGCRIPKKNILGKINEGFQIALSSLDSGRIGIAAQSIGIAEAAFEAACHYANNREQFGKTLINHQSIAFKLADMKVKLEASKLLLFKAAWLKNQHCPFTVEASIAKLFCSEACNAIADEALQIHGGYGYVKGFIPEKLFRDARATTLYEGTSEIQRVIISKQLKKY